MSVSEREAALHRGEGGRQAMPLDSTPIPPPVLPLEGGGTPSWIPQQPLSCKCTGATQQLPSPSRGGPGWGWGSRDRQHLQFHRLLPLENGGALSAASAQTPPTPRRVGRSCA